MERIAETTDRVLVAWILGERTAEASLRELCRSEEGVAFALVRTVEGKRDVLGPERAVAIATRADRASDGRRLYLTRREETFRQLVGDDDPALWIACEPAGAGADAPTLVVIADVEERAPEVLPALPRLARACGALTAADGATLAASAIAHTIGNKAAAVLANLEYVRALIPPDTLEPEDVEEAFANARLATEQLVVEANRLREMASKRG